MLQLYRNGHDAQKVSYGRWASILGATNESREPKLPVAGNPSGVRDRDPNSSAAAAPWAFQGLKNVAQLRERAEIPNNGSSTGGRSLPDAWSFWWSFWKTTKRSTCSHPYAGSWVRGKFELIVLRFY